MQKNHPQIHSNVISKALEVIKEVSPEQHKACEKFIADFNSAVKSDDRLRQKLGFSEIQSKSMENSLTNTSLWDLPAKSIPEDVARAVFAPATAVYRGAKNLIFDNNWGKQNFSSVYHDLQADKKHAKIVSDYKNVVGLFSSIEKWENMHRKRFGFEPIKAGEKFFMSDEELRRCLNKRTFDSIDPTKGQYSVKSLSVGNRVVSGIIGAGFYGVDAFNTTMKLSNDKSKSKKEGKVKFAQQIIRISLASYFTATALGVFKKQTNKSMKSALLVSGVTVLASEILGRMMVGNPVLPTNRRALEEINVKSQNSKNPIVRFGRFLSGKANTPENKIATIKLSNDYVEQRYQTKFFGAKRHGAVSFQGVPKKYKKEDLNTLLQLVHTLDSELAKYYKANILKNLERKGVISKDKASKGFEHATAGLSEIEIGETKTRGERIKEALLAPIRWGKNLGKKISDVFKKWFTKEDKVATHQLNLKKIKELNLEDAYSSELAVFKSSDVFKNKSKLDEEQKVSSFAESFLYVKTKGFGDEIQGIQNSLEWLQKNIKMNKNDKTDSIETIKNLLARKDNEDVKKHFQKITETMNKLSFVAYAKDFVDYDASKYTVANNMLAGALSATFLVFDSYNLTMLHSNDKQKAKDNAAQYATQEGTKTAMSSYVINGINTTFQSFYNASIAGALSLAAVSSLALAGIARLAVGNAILPKTQAELLEQDEKNKNNPMLKITSKMAGRSLKKMDYSTKSDAVRA